MARVKHIKIIDRLVVSKTGSILIIGIEDDQYLIGVSENNIQIMKQLDEPISPDMEEEIKQVSFIHMLKTFLHKENNDGSF